MLAVDLGNVLVLNLHMFTSTYHYPLSIMVNSDGNFVDESEDSGIIRMHNVGMNY